MNYSELGKTMNMIISTIANNASQETLRMIGYDDEDALDSSRPDINGEDLLLKNINPYIKIPGIQNKQKTFINIDYFMGKPTSNDGFIDIEIKIDIIIHKDIQLLSDSKLRLWELMYGIDVLFNRTNLPNIGIGEMVPRGFKDIRAGDLFVGKSLSYFGTYNLNTSCG